MEEKYVFQFHMDFIFLKKINKKNYLLFLAFDSNLLIRNCTQIYKNKFIGGKNWYVIALKGWQWGGKGI